MTTLNRSIDLYVNGDLPGGQNALLQSQTSGNPISGRPQWMMGDRFTLNLYFRETGDAGELTTAYTLPDDLSLALVGKDSSALKTGPVLFSASGADWSKQGADDAVYYQAVLALDTDAVLAAFAAASTDTIDVDVDIKFMDGGNTARLTYRVELTLCRTAYIGTEALPVPGVAYRIKSPGGIMFQISVTDDGQFQLTRV